MAAAGELLNAVARAFSTDFHFHFSLADFVFEELQALEACVHYPAATPYVNFWSNYASDRLYLNPGEFTAVSTFVPQQRYTDHAADCIYGDLNQAFADTEWAQASGWSDNAYLKNLLNPTPPTEENTPETEEN